VCQVGARDYGSRKRFVRAGGAVSEDNGGVVFDIFRQLGDGRQQKGSIGTRPVFDGLRDARAMTASRQRPVGLPVVLSLIVSPISRRAFL
jgi:hypothetical protein